MSRSDQVRAPAFANMRACAERGGFLMPQECSALLDIAEAARDLHEQVEMDESVGIGLSDRAPSLRLGAALANVVSLAPNSQERSS